MFYSNWYYSGIRMLKATGECQTLDQVAERFQLPRQVVAQVIEFLNRTGLCIEQNGKLKVGPQNTHALLREELVSFIAKFLKRIEKSPEEK